MAQRAQRHRAVFIDRDGTLIREKNYLHDPAKVQLITGAVAALRSLRAHGYKLVMVTNQSGIGRGYYTVNDMHRVHEHIQHELGKHGAAFDRIYFCPHHPEKPCQCRKPNLGMVRKAQRTLSLDLKRSFTIGDHAGDFILGQRMGGKGIFVLTGHGRLVLEEKLHTKAINDVPDKIVRNLPAAVRWILAQEQKG